MIRKFSDFKRLLKEMFQRYLIIIDRSIFKSSEYEESIRYELSKILMESADIRLISRLYVEEYEVIIPTQTIEAAKRLTDKLYELYKGKEASGQFKEVWKTTSPVIALDKVQDEVYSPNNVKESSKVVEVKKDTKKDIENYVSEWERYVDQLDPLIKRFKEKKYSFIINASFSSLIPKSKYPDKGEADSLFADISAKFNGYKEWGSYSADGIIEDYDKDNWIITCPVIYDSVMGDQIPSVEELRELDKKLEDHASDLVYLLIRFFDKDGNYYKSLSTSEKFEESFEKKDKWLRETRESKVNEERKVDYPFLKYIKGGKNADPKKDDYDLVNLHKGLSGRLEFYTGKPQFMIDIDSEVIADDYLTKDEKLTKKISSEFKDYDGGGFSDWMEDWIKKQGWEVGELRGGNTYNEDSYYFWGSVFEWTTFVTDDGKEGIIIMWHLGGDVRGNYSDPEVWFGDVESFYSAQSFDPPDEEIAYLLGYKGDHKKLLSDIEDWRAEKEMFYDPALAKGQKMFKGAKEWGKEEKPGTKGFENKSHKEVKALEVIDSKKGPRRTELKRKENTWLVTWEKDDKEGRAYHEVEKVRVPSSVPEDELADWLSDKYGWLVSTLEKVKESNSGLISSLLAGESPRKLLLGESFFYKVPDKIKNDALKKLDAAISKETLPPTKKILRMLRSKVNDGSLNMFDIEDFKYWTGYGEEDLEQDNI